MTLRDSAFDIFERYCHCEYMSGLKADRLQIRVDPADKALLERAAAAAHLNVSAFVVQAAAARAPRTAKSAKPPGYVSPGNGSVVAADESAALGGEAGHGRVGALDGINPLRLRGPFGGVP